MIYEPIPYKRCTQCREWFERTLENFTRDASKKDCLRPRCRKCHNRDGQNYKKTHPQQVKQSGQLFRKKHLECARQYRSRHRDKSITYTRNYYATHRKQFREWGKVYYLRTKEIRRAKNRQRYRENPSWFLVASSKRRASKKALPSTFTSADWRRCLNYWHGVCAYCGKPPQLWDRYTSLHQEHHIPLQPGYNLSGPNPGYVPQNIVPACQSCNLSKHNQDPLEWVLEHFGNRKGKSVLKRIQTYFEWIEKQNE